MPALHKDLIANAANEGIPVGAIARIFMLPMDDTYEVLHGLKSIGTIADLPRPDWPATARLADRVPSGANTPSDADLAFQCRQVFRLTTLEAGFLVVLLKHERVEKHKLHNIVEQQRLTRSSQPSAMEATDPKMVDVMICKLRKKLKALDPLFTITTIWGGGYHLTADVKTRMVEFMKNGGSDALQEARVPPTEDRAEAAA